MARQQPVTGIERRFDPNEIIVSKTDGTGRITYANRTFLQVSGYGERETLGQPHSFIRHPDMPRCVFKLLWDRLAERQEVFAYVVNRAKGGDHYWVLAHVTPSFDAAGAVVGYHSSRRSPDAGTVAQVIAPLYHSLKAEEDRHDDRKAGLAAGAAMLGGLLQQKGLDYDRFVLSL